MSKVVNEPKIKNPLIKAIRELLEHRALWLYLLCDEARKKGLLPQDFAPAAIRRCGHMQGRQLVKKGRTKSLKGLRRTLFTKPAQLVFEMKIQKCTDNELEIHFHYCPLVKAWQKAGCSDEEIACVIQPCAVTEGSGRLTAAPWICRKPLQTAMISAISDITAKMP